MADIKIIVDSGSDIPQDIADKYNIGVISFLSIFGTEQYVQRTEKMCIRDRCESKGRCRL